MRIGHVMPGLLVALTMGTVLSGCCQEKEKPVGEVDGASPVAMLDGSEAWQGDQIRAGKIINTGEMGLVTFHTDDVASCTALCNSRLQIRPDEKVAIKWLGASGATLCNKKSGQARQRFSINDEISISLDDPIFGVLLREKESLVRLIDGSAIVTVEGLEERIQVGPGQELVIPSEGTPLLRPLTLSEEEWEIVQDLGGVAPTPAPETPEAPTNTPEPKPTKAATLTPEPTVALTPSPDGPCGACAAKESCNCSDFSTWEQAKACLDAYPEDPFGLDADHDGIPCESLLGELQ